MNEPECPTPIDGFVLATVTDTAELIEGATIVDRLPPSMGSEILIVVPSASSPPNPLSAAVYPTHDAALTFARTWIERVWDRERGSKRREYT